MSFYKFTTGYAIIPGHNPDIRCICACLCFRPANSPRHCAYLLEFGSRMSPKHAFSTNARGLEARVPKSQAANRSKLAGDLTVRNLANGVYNSFEAPIYIHICASKTVVRAMGQSVPHVNASVQGLYRIKNKKIYWCDSVTKSHIFLTHPHH